MARGAPADQAEQGYLFYQAWWDALFYQAWWDAAAVPVSGVGAGGLPAAELALHGPEGGEHCHARQAG